MSSKTPLITLAFLAALCIAAFSGCSDTDKSPDTAPEPSVSPSVTAAPETSAATAAAPVSAADTSSEAGSSSGASSAESADDEIIDVTDASFMSEPLARAQMTAGSNTLTFSFTDVKCDLSLYIHRYGEKEYRKYPLEKDTAGNYGIEISFTSEELAEVRLIGDVGGKKVFNEYFIDRSGNTDKGYVYKSLDSCVEAYMNTAKTNNFVLLADNTVYEYGSLRSLNQATHITAEDVSAFTGGEIYSVASPEAADKSTVSWYKLSDGEWTALSTDLSTEPETGNIGARADLDGAGIYVLMGEPK